MTYHITEELRGRSAVYRLLAQLYRRELSPELAEQLRAGGLLELLTIHGYDARPEHLDDEERIGALRREYARLFIGPGLHVAPYGSVHHPDDTRRGQLWGDSTLWLKRFTTDHGLKFEGSAYDGIPDHIGHVLEIFAILLERQADLEEVGDPSKAVRLARSQRILFEKQMARWFPIFCRQVMAQSGHGLYHALAHLTLDLLSEEQARLVPASKRATVEGTDSKNEPRPASGRPFAPASS